MVVAPLLRLQLASEFANVIKLLLTTIKIIIIETDILDTRWLFAVSCKS